MDFFLKDEEIGLRCLNTDDIENGYIDWLNSKTVCNYNSHHKYPVSKEELLHYINETTLGKDVIVLAVIALKDMIHIGNISLQEIDLINRQAELAFLFGDTRFWGKGFATRAAILLVEHAFDELGLNRIYFGTADNNKAMQKIAVKMGFQRVGVKRQALYKHGQFHDIYDYDLLRSEWDTGEKH